MDVKIAPYLIGCFRLGYMEFDCFRRIFLRKVVMNHFSAAVPLIFTWGWVIILSVRVCTFLNTDRRSHNADYVTWLDLQQKRGGAWLRA